MINEAERQGKLKPGGTIVEPTSGNTGIGLALIAAVRGYKFILVMPESMSMERASLLSSYGAQLVLTPAWEGMKGPIREAESICRAESVLFHAGPILESGQSGHAQEDDGAGNLEALDGKIDAFVAAVGTGGTITGCGEVFKERNPNVKVIAVEPAGSPVLSGGDPGPHKIQGIGAGFIPQVLNRKILDRVIKVTDDEAYQTAKQLSKMEGLLVGISAGANVFAAQQVAEELGPGRTS